MIKIPRSDEKSNELFRSLLPDDSRISVRPMFGNMAGFVNGNLFAGLFGEDLFVRLSKEDLEVLLKTKGTKLFEPMKGRAMKGYVVVPRAWTSQKEMVTPWIRKSLDWTGKLPEKTKGSKSRTRKKK